MTVVRRVHRHVLGAAALASDFLAGLPKFACGGERGFFVEFRIPITQRIAVPRRLGFEFGQTELVS
jgi:hypothetical protein